MMAVRKKNEQGTSYVIGRAMQYRKCAFGKGQFEQHRPCFYGEWTIQTLLYSGSSSHTIVS